MISSNLAKQTFGRVLEAAQHEPVLITKHNYPTAVVLSTSEYDRLKLGAPVAHVKNAPHPGPFRAKTLPVIRRKPGTKRNPLSAEAMLALVKSADLEVDA